jgi:NADH:ubiquinone oxidoreductase subunit C
MSMWNRFENLTRDNKVLISDIWPVSNNLCVYLNYGFPKFFSVHYLDLYENEVILFRSQVPFAMQLLRYHLPFLYTVLCDIVVVDKPGSGYRFVVIYIVLSIKYATRIRIRVACDEVMPLYSLNWLYRSALWMEREVWDMYGISYFRHPDLRRILTDYGFNGFPLRKDFPLTGYWECMYRDRYRRIGNVKMSLVQAVRLFRFSQAWNTNNISMKL